MVAGLSSPGCTGPVTTAVRSVPRVGNAQVSLTSHNAPPSAAGIAAFSLGRLQNPIPLAGIELWVDPARPLVHFAAQPKHLSLTVVSLEVIDAFRDEL